MTDQPVTDEALLIAARTDAVNWLFGIARHQLLYTLQRGRVERRARDRLGMPRIELDDEDLERILGSRSSSRPPRCSPMRSTPCRPISAPRWTRGSSARGRSAAGASHSEPDTE